MLRRIQKRESTDVKIAVVDCGSGNLRSVIRALERAAQETGIAASVNITQNPEEVLNACRLDDPLSEAEIVNYADKRVLHDQVVPLQNRLAYILERYGLNEERRERIRFMWEQTEHLETKLFRCLEMTPAALENVQWDHALMDDFDRFCRSGDAA